MSADDLSGEWQGIFNYPADAPPTAFRATLRDVDEVLTGHTVEPSLLGGSIAARLRGKRKDNEVSFIKLYEADSDLYDDVVYQGSVSGDGLEIIGRWSVPGHWSGTFIMARERADPKRAVRADVATMKNP